MFLEKRMTDSLANDWLVSGWSLAPALSEMSDEATFLEKRVARLLAGGWPLAPALSEVSDEAVFLEKRVARLLARGWSLAPASPVISGGAAFLEKRMAGSLAGGWLVSDWWCLTGGVWLVLSASCIFSNIFWGKFSF